MTETLDFTDPARLRVPSPPTGVAVIGCGYWGVNYVRIFEEFPDSEIRVVCDKRPEELAKIGRRFPHLTLTTDVDQALATPGVDAAVIATTAHSHHDLARRALLAGCHVLVEKPLTTRSETASDLQALSAELGLVLVVGHTFLYNPAVRKVKEYLDRDDVYYLYSRRTNLGPIRTDVNAVWDLAVHDVSIFNYLLGAEPLWVSAVGARVLSNDQEDVAFISLGYPDEVVGHIHVSWTDPHKVREIVVVSPERRIVFNDVEAVERVRIYEKGVRRVDDPGPSFGNPNLLMRDGDIISLALPASEPLRNECGHFLHCVRRQEEVYTPCSQGLSVVRVLEAVDRSIATGGTPVTLASEPEAARL